MSLTPFLRLDEVPALDAATVTLDAATRHHLRRVLRLTEGADVLVTDGRGSIVPARLAGDGVVATGAVVAQPDQRPQLVLAQSVPKGRRFDDVVRTSVELGVDRIVPLVTERTVVRLDGAERERARARWQAVADAAAAQARRAWWPRVDEVLDPVTLIDRSRASEGRCVVVVAEPGAPSPTQVLRGGGAALATADRVVVAIGPEGGWSPSERERFARDAAIEVGLGASVLRTEHAGVAAIAALSAVLGRWDAPVTTPDGTAPPLPS
jgi:16S rRNA (uracil1498-N3)-methyltransferase